MELLAEMSRGLCPAGSIKVYPRLKIEPHLLGLKSDLDGTFPSCKEEIEWVQTKLVLPCVVLNTCQKCSPPSSLRTEFSHASACVIPSICQRKLMLLSKGNKTCVYIILAFSCTSLLVDFPRPWPVHT